MEMFFFFSRKIIKYVDPLAPFGVNTLVTIYDLQNVHHIE